MVRKGGGRVGDGDRIEQDHRDHGRGGELQRSGRQEGPEGSLPKELAVPPVQMVPLPGGRGTRPGAINLSRAAFAGETRLTPRPVGRSGVFSCAYFTGTRRRGFSACASRAPATSGGSPGSIRPGDVVGGSTTRRDPEAPADVPGAERARRRVWIVVATEQVEFHGFTKHVRVTGPIREGPFDIGRHHTLDLQEGDEVTVLKSSMSASDRVLLDEGIAGTGEPTILLAAVDWGTRRSCGSGGGPSNRWPTSSGPSPGSGTKGARGRRTGRATPKSSSRFSAARDPRPRRSSWRARGS